SHQSAENGQESAFQYVLQVAVRPGRTKRVLGKRIDNARKQKHPALVELQSFGTQIHEPGANAQARPPIQQVAETRQPVSKAVVKATIAANVGVQRNAAWRGATKTKQDNRPSGDSVHT